MWTLIKKIENSNLYAIFFKVQFLEKFNSLISVDQRMGGIQLWSGCGAENRFQQSHPSSRRMDPDGSA